jgi:hypothetical protein
MTLRFSYGHRDDDVERRVHQMAEAPDDDHYHTARRERMAATLLDASTRLEAQGRRRLQIDLLDIATRMIAGDSYARPRLE